MRKYFTKALKRTLGLTVILLSLNLYSQGRYASQQQQITLKGIIVEKETQQVLEYATVVMQHVKTKKLTGGITNSEGIFTFEVNPGVYDISFEFIGFKKVKLSNQKITANHDFGIIKLAADTQNLDEVEIIAEKTTVEIKLDKKIYNVGKDMTVKGGTASDVLENVPSVTVDQDGTISLRGNDNVTIFINGKPSALAGINGSDALRQLPAEAIAKVEVITSPSARYDAEGSGGIINIILRRSKLSGFNGSTQLNLGNPDRIGVNANLNYRTKKFNFFTNTAFNYRQSPGSSTIRQENLNNTGGEHFLDEDRRFARENNSFNSLAGIEYYLSKKSSITATLFYRKSGRKNTTINNSDKFFLDRTLSASSLRIDRRNRDNETSEYSLNYTKSFKKDDDHKLSFDFKLDESTQFEDGIVIENNIFPTTELIDQEFVITDVYRRNLLLQGDYVLPIKKDGRFEFGFKNTFNTLITDFVVDTLNASGVRVSDANFTNKLDYSENILAIYTQYGTKFNKISFLFGLRMEITDANIDLVTTNENFDKNYTEFFPTININYEVSDTESFTIGYNRRIRRPRSRFINPFPSRSSATNLFSGNPDINPSYTNSYEIGYLNRLNKLTINSSIYYRFSTDVFTFISEETGDFTSDGIPIILRMPVNLSTNTRYGFELAFNYNPTKKWRINSSFNLFNSQTRGDFNGRNFDADNTTWFTRFSSKVTLPKDIDFQTTFFYRGPSETAQSKRDGMFSTNISFSKDLFKQKATLTVNVSDVFNSRKFSGTNFTPTTVSKSDFQWRRRSVNLAFTYRFNQKKKRQRQQRRDDNGGDEEFGG